MKYRDSAPYTKRLWKDSGDRKPHIATSRIKLKITFSDLNPFDIWCQVWKMFVLSKLKRIDFASSSLGRTP